MGYGEGRYEKGIPDGSKVYIDPEALIPKKNPEDEKPEPEKQVKDELKSPEQPK